jgi:type II restriction enzyme
LALNLADYDQKAQEAVKAFWGNRAAALQKQMEAGRADRGERGSATAGKNMDGFAALLKELVELNGLPDATILNNRRLLTLPGYFRPTKLWDVLVVCGGELVAAVELKSHVGSFGNNFNNRAEEAIGSAHDLWTLFHEGGLGKQPAPFVGWLMLVEDETQSRRPITAQSGHFPLLPEFQSASYLERYNLLCQKLVQKQLYTFATVITSSREAVDTGEYRELSELTGLRTFVGAFAGHIAGVAARRQS